MKTTQELSRDLKQAMLAAVGPGSMIDDWIAAGDIRRALTERAVALATDHAALVTAVDTICNDWEEAIKDNDDQPELDREATVLHDLRWVVGHAKAKLS
jgi:phosphosulfolactate phosphohydrolase-like enzyme